MPTEVLSVGNANATALSPSLLSTYTSSLGVAGAGATAIDLAVTSSFEVALDVGLARARGSAIYTDLIRDRGREPIGVDQPMAGSVFPFRERHEGNDLVADFYLSIQGECSPARPFHIKCLYGFGTIPNSQPEYFDNDDPKDFEIIVVDDDDNVVFSSLDLDAEALSHQYWNDRLLIVEWKAAAAVCRIVVFTSWSQEQTPQPFNLFYELEDADLDDRSVEQLPRRVRTITVGVDTAEAEDVFFDAGYNTEMIISDPAVVGRRTRTTISLSAIPGKGLGRYSNCEELEQDIKRINGITADDRGNFSLDALDCYRAEVPHEIESEDAVAIPEPATLQLFNDCGPCADCQDYINVYEAVRKLYDQVRDLGSRAEAVRDQYAANKDRWEDELTCRLEKRLKASAIALCGNRVSLTVGFCNINEADTVAAPVSLAITVTSGGMTPVVPIEIDSTYRSGNYTGPMPVGACRQDFTPIAYFVPSVVDNLVTFDFDGVAPSRMGIGSLIVTMLEDGEGEPVNFSITALVAASPVETISLTVDPASC